MTIPELLVRQKTYFKTGETKDITFRKNLLKQLRSEILSRENDIYDALKKDFNKPSFEAYLSEIAILKIELDLAIKKLSTWAKPKRVFPSLLNFPSTDYIYSEPYGTTLVIAPWNYPFQLAITPVIAAVAAGNTCIVKPSELTVNTSLLVEAILHKVFTRDHVAVVQGGIPVATKLLKQKWDYIFFTGSVPVGKIVAKAAAEHLTPVTLELGGKTPCIIDGTVDMKLVARRLVWGKFYNAGQTCIAPDYIIIKKDVKEELIHALKYRIQKAYGKDPMNSPDFARIINIKNFDRLKSLFENEKIAFGGDCDRENRYISPTLIDEPDLNSKLMRDEIFGPILPVLTYETEEDIDAIIHNFPKSLSLYVFSSNSKFANRMTTRYSFGGGAINDTMVHFGNKKLPFGGVGDSGMGAYHGKYGFDAFSHKKSIVKKGNWLDIRVRYAPHKNKLGLLKKMVDWLG